MKYKVKFSSSFKKAYKKLSEFDKTKAINLVTKLPNDEILDQKHKDHKLKGNYKGCRECHILPDLLLIYQKDESILLLYCIEIGSHSELF